MIKNSCQPRILYPAKILKNKGIVLSQERNEILSEVSYRWRVKQLDRAIRTPDSTSVTPNSWVGGSEKIQTSSLDLGFK